MKKFWRPAIDKADKISKIPDNISKIADDVSKIANGAPRNLPLEPKKKDSQSVLALFQTAQRSIKQKIAPSKTIQEIFQEAQKTARKSARAAEKVRQKSPPKIQSAISDGVSFFILKFILAAAAIIFLLSSINLGSVIVFIYMIWLVIKLIISD